MDERKLRHDIRQMQRHYDDKRYKKALKLSDDILSRNPTHAETMALKALCLLCSPGISGEDPLDVAKLAVRTNPKVCAAWHAMGLVQKDRGEYTTALRTLKMAWRLANGSLNVLRDLIQAGLQSQRYGELTELATIPSPPVWARAALTCAFWLGGRVDLACALLSDAERLDAYQVGEGGMSELMLVKGRLLAEHQGPSAALDHLLVSEELILDKRALLELRARLYVSYGRPLEAHVMYTEQLLPTLPSNLDYLLLCLATHPNKEISDAFPLQTPSAPYRAGAESQWDLLAKRLESAPDLPLFRLSQDLLVPRMETDWVPVPSREKRNLRLGNVREGELRRLEVELALRSKNANGDALEAYMDEVVAAHPNVTMEVARLLVYRAGPRLDELLSEFLVKGWNKGVPSLFTITAPLLIRQKAAVDGVVASQTELDVVGRLFRDVYRSELLAYERKFSDALALIDSVATDLPSSVEVWSVKSEIHRLSGDDQAAYDAIECARQLDLQDRFVNCTTVEALCRLGRETEAHELAKLFSQAPGQAACNLKEMQALWFMEAMAQATRDTPVEVEWLQEIKKCVETTKDDIADFHFFCARKLYLKQYVEYSSLCDRLCDHQAYGRAVQRLISIHLHNGETEAAESMALEMRSRTPIQPGAWAASAQVAHATGNREVFVQVCSKLFTLRRCRPYDYHVVPVVAFALHFDPSIAGELDESLSYPTAEKYLESALCAVDAECFRELLSILEGYALCSLEAPAGLIDGLKSAVSDATLEEARRALHLSPELQVPIVSMFSGLA
ncbi:MAG: hypothetical protein KVP17_000422 [Porospora cf. gigantea B]|uniref:uncharacterized protein n=1 Tax=Porospora cf. gigantea B TaxID=2853592 RepID=UPI003571CF79|nr:MAG: hypothetical protein KVP17_000422 [Porospora cf. gigantea B]